MSERKRYHKDNAPTDDIITLINLVRQNPALYNYKLQPNQRRRPDILSGWLKVSQQMGNKYSVQEVRRKWKNLRDTYHQYRRRSPKCIEGRLSKWRYAKPLDFLSKVYQPKLKAQRNALAAMLQIKKQPDDDDDDVDLQHDHEHEHDMDHDVIDEDGEHSHSDATGLSSSHHASSQITLVSDEAETFILTAYEESVADDPVPTHGHHGHHGVHGHTHAHPHHHHHPHHGHHLHHHHHHQTPHDGSISSIELSQITQDDDEVDDVDGVEDELDEEDDGVDHDGHQVVDIVKHELDEDGATGAEVDYEEVCLYEEATAGHCEMGVDGSSDVTDSKGFHYIDAHGFCIEDIEPEPEPEPEPEQEPERVALPLSLPLRTAVTLHNPHQQQQTHHFATATVSSATATNSVLGGGGGTVITADTKLKNLTLVTTTAAGTTGALVQHRHEQQQQHHHQQIALVDVTEATSTSVTISSTPASGAASVTAASVVSTTLPIVGVAPPTTLCNTSGATSGNSFSSPSTAILQLPTLSCGSVNASPISVASSSCTLIKEDEQQQQQLSQSQSQSQSQQSLPTLSTQSQQQSLVKRDELDLFFDFLKKKMQYFSKTQITHIQMEFLNCVSRQEEAADLDAKD